MNISNEILEANIVKLNQKHLSKLNGLVPSDLNPVLAYEVEQKLLAVFALQAWLKEYHLHIPMEGLETLDQDLFQLLCLPFTTGLKLGNFKICVILHKNEEEDIADIPAIAVELPKLAAHLYIFVTLPEEVGGVSTNQQMSIQGSILGFVRHDQIRGQKLDIRYDEELRSYGVSLTNLEASFSALYTCTRYVNPDKVVVPSSLRYPVSGLVSSRTITEKMAAPTSASSWLVELLTGEEINYILGDENYREELLKQQVLSKPIFPKINLYEWFQEIINNGQSNLLTPRQFVGSFRGKNEHLAEEQIRDLIALKEIPEHRSILQSQEIKLGSLAFQYITVAWPKSEEKLDAGVNLCLLLIPLSEKYLRDEMSVTIQQQPLPDDIYEIPEFDFYFDLILELGLQNEIRIGISYKEAIYEQKLIYLDSAA